MRLLALFDCDGTLFLSDDALAQDAMVEALSRMTGTRVDKSAFEALDHDARTSRWMAREVIRKHGLRAIDLAEWAELVEDIYLERLPRATDWQSPPGAYEALAELEADDVGLALLTGVPKRIARERMRRIGLGEFFAGGQGAYGSETEDRDDLIRLALERAGVQPQEAVHVGDTSRDVSCAQALGLKTIATAFDGCYASNAGDADGAVRTMPELVAAIRR